MKHIKHFLILFCILFSVNANATKVSKEDAAIVAKNYFSEVNMSRNGHASVVIKESFELKKGDAVMYYIFNIQDGGYIIISAEDNFTPVLGYSPDGYYSEGNMADGFDFMMEEFSGMIETIRNNNIATTPEYSTKWARYRSAQHAMLGRNIAGTPIIGPLTALWNQDYPYNYYCPPVPNSGPGGKAYTGCVATAMSLIMYYWRWPWQGTDTKTYRPQACAGTQMPILTANFEETTYDYDGMWGTPTENAAGFFYEPLSLLQYHAGISVNMAYCGGEGSGAQSETVPSAMRKYFKYSSDITFITRQSVATTEEWAAILKPQMDLKQPVYTSGRSTGGHAFVCDGYDSDNLFHYNFGWDGSSNGYFIADKPSEFVTSVASIINFVPDRSKGYPLSGDHHAIITHSKGLIQDYSSPAENYSKGVTYTWLFDPEISGNKVDYITFASANMNVAAGDVVRIYDGSDDNATLLGEYSGTSNFGPVVTSGGKGFIKFTSAASSPTAPGFQISYQVKFTQFCTPSAPTTLTAAAGTFTDGSPEEYNYPNETVCRWYVFPDGAVADNTQITFDFTRLDTEAGNDEIKFYDYEGSVKPKAILSGSYPPDQLPQITIDAKKVMVTFSSNSSVNGKGFEMIYSTYPVSIREIENIKNINIYPNPVSSNQQLNVSFTVESIDDIQINLYNVVGQLVKQDFRNNFSGQFNEPYDVSNLTKGIYLLQIHTSKGNLTRKVSVQ
jgi:hypothetical protein